MSDRGYGVGANGSGKSVYVIGCANGMIGYLPPKEAYDEGAYEVLWSMLFYNLPRPRRGGFEFLAERAHQLIQTQSCAIPHEASVSARPASLPIS